MKLVLTAVLLITWHATAFAQNQPHETTPTHQDRDGGDTSHSGTGSTGWTGAPGVSQSRPGNQSTPETTGTAAENGAASGQPEMATGKDLKGPPAQFPPTKTPE